jgi:hypothetical protein
LLSDRKIKFKLDSIDAIVNQLEYTVLTITSDVPDVAATCVYGDSVSTSKIKFLLYECPTSLTKSGWVTDDGYTIIKKYV